jgi:hypothetical protein
MLKDVNREVPICTKLNTFMVFTFQKGDEISVEDFERLGRPSPNRYEKMLKN